MQKSNRSPSTPVQSQTQVHSQLPEKKLLLLQKNLNAHFAQNKNLSLFDRLQYFDALIDQMKIGKARNSQGTMKIFKAIVEEFGYEVIRNSQSQKQREKDKKKVFSVGVYNSPSSFKKNMDDVEDPELFSFSKTRKQQQSGLSKQMNSNQHKPLFNNKQIISPLYQKMKNEQNAQNIKIKQRIKLKQRQGQRASKNNKFYSDKPRYFVNSIEQNNEQQNQEQFHRKVSQFNSQIVQQQKSSIHQQKSFSLPSQRPGQHYHSPQSLHSQSEILKAFLLKKSSKLFFSLLKRSIVKRRHLFNKKTSALIFELKIMKKVFKILLNAAQNKKQMMSEWKQQKNRYKLKDCFDGWYEWVNRSEGQRSREVQIERKEVLLVKWLGIRKFIENSRILDQNVSQQINFSHISYTNYVKQLKKSLKNKQKLLQKFVGFSRLINRINLIKQYESELSQKRQLLNIQKKSRNLNQFNKLVRCLSVLKNKKEEKKIQLVRRKVGMLRVMNRLKSQFIFQRAYWTKNYDWRQSLLQRPNNEIQQISQFNLQPYKATVPLILNQNYQKILLIYNLLDCIQHNLNRKGYSFLQSPSCSSSCLSLSQNPIFLSHPSFSHYFRPYKLNKYFSAFKEILITKRDQGEKEVKYGIIGRRVLNTIKYKAQIDKNNRKIQDKIQQKIQQFKKRKEEKEIKNVYRMLGYRKNFERKVQKVSRFILRQKLFQTLMILKTYHISKRHYRSVLLSFKRTNSHKLLQCSFFEWKLFRIQNVHYRILQRQVENLKKANAIKAMSENWEENSLPDRIFKRKCENLKLLRLRSYGEQFLKALKFGLKTYGHPAQTRQQLSSKSLQLSTFLQTKKEQLFLSNITQLWFLSKLTQNIFTQLSLQYNNKVLKKSFLGLKKMLEATRLERQKSQQIYRKKCMRVKKNVMNCMIQKMILGYRIRGLCRIVRGYWGKRLIQSISQ